MNKRLIIIAIVTILAVGTMGLSYLPARAESNPFLANIASSLRQIQAQIEALQQQLQALMSQVGFSQAGVEVKSEKEKPAAKFEIKDEFENEIKDEFENEIKDEFEDEFEDFESQDDQNYSEPGAFIPPYPAQGASIVLEELPGTPSVSCQLPNLSRGSQAKSVYLLQMVLNKGGYYPEGLITGYFGPLTEKAIKAYQSKNNLPTSGKLDSATINSLQNLVSKFYPVCRSKKPTSNQRTITVRSPKSGETWYAGKTYYITWNPINIQPASSSAKNYVTINLELNTPDCPTGAQCSLAPSYQPYLVAAKAPDTGYYRWTVPNDLPPVYFGGNKVITIKSSDGRFGKSGVFSVKKNISHKPSIQILSPGSGEVWQVGKQYQIRWVVSKEVIEKVKNRKYFFFDLSLYPESLFNRVNRITKAIGFEGASTKRILYSSKISDLLKGVYTWTPDDSAASLSSQEPVVVVLRMNLPNPDNPDLSLKGASQGFWVKNPNKNFSAIKILSPGSGEVWQTGRSYRIIWEPINISQPLYIDLVKPTDTTAGGWSVKTVARIASELPPTATSFYWRVPDNIPSANDYKIRIMTDDDVGSVSERFTIY